MSRGGWLIAFAWWVWALGPAGGWCAAQNNRPPSWEGETGPPAPHQDSFESDRPSWTFAGADTPYRVERHERTTTAAHDGRRAELVSLTAGNGSRILLVHRVASARVIEDLVPSLWVKSDRAGLQLLARVVLPTAIDPATGRAAWLWIPGGQLEARSAWQRLTVSELARQVAAQVRFLRLRLGPEVDVRGAYVDQLALNVYGGPGITTVWLDALDLAGYVPVAAGSPAPGQLATHLQDAAGAPGNAAVTGPRIELEGTVLVVNRRPFFPRAIEYRGESLEFLRNLGFNTLRLSQAPDRELLVQARRAGLWIVCPPPRPAGLADDGPLKLAPLGELFDGVLAWDLGSGLDRRQLEQTRRWAEAVREADARVGRPLVCGPLVDLRGYSRPADILVCERGPLGTSLELSDYGTWLRERPRLARPGTPFWTAIQTHWSPELVTQLEQFTGGRARWPVDFDGLRLLVFTALGAGARGLCFASPTRLDGDDPLAAGRALALERINLELQLVERWAASASYVTSVTANLPEIAAAVLETERTRLLLPTWSGAAAQIVPGQAAANGVSFVVPGVPEACDAFELSPAGLEPLELKRVTGGSRITLGEFGLASIVVLTQDPVVLTQVRGRLAAVARRATELARESAVSKVARVAELDQRLSAGGQPQREATEWLAAARANLAQADNLLLAGDATSAWRELERAGRPLRMLERTHWEQAVAPLSSPGASPLALVVDGLPRELDFRRRLERASPSANLLVGGEFELLDRTLRAGWQLFQYDVPGIQTRAELVREAPHGGGASLRLTVAPGDPNQAPGLVESPPVWVTSPTVEVPAGQLVRFRASVRVTAPVSGSVDGLEVIESLGGPALAERIGQTDGWRELVLYRFAPTAGPVSLTFALSGLGTADIDDVAIERIDPPGGTTPAAAARSLDPRRRALPPILPR